MRVESKAVKIPVEERVLLEGVYVSRSQANSAVLCHPHPLHGGSMDNNVLFAAEETLGLLSMSTLRFNFRGVGQSTGQHGGGIKEAKDVISACHFLKEEAKETKVHIVAYSFGVFAFLHAIAEGLTVDSCTLISPPLSAMDFRDLSVPNIKTAIIVGDCDEYCRPKNLEQWLARWPEARPHLQQTVLKDTDHFYNGQESILKDTLFAFFKRGL